MGKGYLTKYLRKLGCGGQNGVKKFRLYYHSFTLYSIFLFDVPSILAASFLLPCVIRGVFKQEGSIYKTYYIGTHKLIDRF